MEILLKILVWLFMSGIGLALSAASGGELGIRDEKQAISSSLRIISVCFIAWIITISLLTAYQSWWYCLSLIIAGGYFGLCYSGAKASVASQEDATPLAKGEYLREEMERQVLLFEQLLTTRITQEDYLPESRLPVPKEDMATAIQTVYWFRIMALNIQFDYSELLTRYAALSHFLADEDALFMNDFIGLISRNDECVSFVRSHPQQFYDNRERMQHIFAEVDSERSKLILAWDITMSEWDEKQVDN